MHKTNRNNGRVVVIFSTYNSESYVKKCLESCLSQDYDDLFIIVSDDGSTDNTISVLENAAIGYSNFTLIPLEHKERGYARYIAIEEAKKLDPRYLYIIDSDMVLEEGLISKCVKYLSNNIDIGGLIIPEFAFSNFKNFYSKVKVFERNIINNAGNDVGKNSIEAARFWNTTEYLSTGGINMNQISFEETQPTIRYLEDGGNLKRATFTKVYHDEKYVTLSNIIKKKNYYFGVMHKTINSEKNGFLKALQRWYFFRPVLYRKDNLKEYIKHPLLTIGLINMYIFLTLIGCINILKSFLHNK